MLTTHTRCHLSLFLVFIVGSTAVRVSTQEAATPEQAGRLVYAQHCESCHGADRSGVTSPNELGVDRFKSVVRDGVGQMPGYPESMISPAQLDALVAYVLNPSAGVPQIGALSASASAQQTAAGGKDGAALLQRLCLSCHSHAQFDSLNYERPQWQRVVEDMKPRGVEGTEQELETLVDYLSQHYGPGEPSEYDH